MKEGARAAVIAWLITSIYYFYQYVMRSAPAVMVPHLSEAFGLSAGGLAALVGLFYFAYSPFSLVAGVAMDQLGPRRVIPLGAATVAIGALMFATGDPTVASIGRFLQGAGGVFALIGAASHRQPVKELSGIRGLSVRADRRDPDVRHGRRIGRTIRGWPRDCRRSRLEPVLGDHGRRRAGDRRAAVHIPAQTAAQARKSAAVEPVGQDKPEPHCSRFSVIRSLCCAG